MRGVQHTVIGAIGDERTHSSLETLTAWPQVERVMPVQKRYKLVSREAHKANSRITVGKDIVIGGMSAFYKKQNSGPRGPELLCTYET